MDSLDFVVSFFTALDVSILILAGNIFSVLLKFYTSLLGSSKMQIAGNTSLELMNFGIFLIREGTLTRGNTPFFYIFIER